MARLRKKSKKIRGAKTGRGSGKRARGAGNRGGRGRAGLGKRAGHRKSMLKKYPEMDLLGKHGFKSVKQGKSFHPVKINTKTLENILDKLLSKNLIKKEKDSYEIDLSKLGYSKLIGNGLITKKMIIKVDSFSESSKKRVEDAGGKIVSNKDNQ